MKLAILLMGASFGACLVAFFLVRAYLELRPAIFRFIAPFLLRLDTHAPLESRRKFLERMTGWIQGKTFRELPGPFLADLCLIGLVHEGPNSSDLIRIVELIQRYGSMGQKASFARAVGRDAVMASAKLAPRFLDVLESCDFQVGAKRKLAADMRSIYAERLVREDVVWTHERLARAMRTKRIRNARKRIKVSAPPKRRRAPVWAQGAGEV